MWQVYNRTCFAVDRSWIRDRDGAEVWLVAVRCTFRVNPDGSTMPEETQEPVVLVPKYFGPPAASSLQYDTDFVLTKPTTDVILHGSAYAPNGEPTTAVDASLHVGDVMKTLRVSGDRLYQEGLLGVSPGEILPFTKLPLTYERAYGGSTSSNGPGLQFDDRNPVGTGYRSLAGTLAPNITYPSRSRSKQPACFGPIPSHWKPRSTYAGAYDDTWVKERQPLYPRDLDDRFFLCSPEDQRPPEFLQGGEPVELMNLTPGGWLVFRLPRVALGFETVFTSGERVQHRARLYTVIIESDVPRVILIWRTSLRCHEKVQSLLGTVIWQKRTLWNNGDEAV